MMRTYLKNIKLHIVTPAVRHMGFHKDEESLAAAVNLVFYTMLVESNCRRLTQVQGPALGWGQVEPATIASFQYHYLRSRRDTRLKLEFFIPEGWSYIQAMMTCPLFMAAFIRCFYFPKQRALPKANDVEGMGDYWKDFYNTSKGKGTVVKFVKRIKNHA